MGKLKTNFEIVVMVLLALTAYACSATKPSILEQAKTESAPSSQQNVLPQNNDISVQSDPSEIKKNEPLKPEEVDSRVEEILAYMREKESKIAAKPKKISKSVVRSKSEEDYTEMVGKDSAADDSEHIRESVAEDVAMAEQTDKVPDNAVGEAEFSIRYSKKLGLKLDGTENQQLLDAISKWFGSPYRMGGCSKGGVDCSCFVKSVYEDVYGIQLTRTSRSMYRNAERRVSKSQLQEGDMIYFKIRGRRISHVGIYLGDNKFAHSSRSYGVVIGDLNAPYYKKRFVSGGRVGEEVSMNDDAKSKKKLR